MVQMVNSVFEVVDDLIESLKIDLNSGKSSNLFASSQSATIKLPNTGPKANMSFKYRQVKKL